MWPTFPMRQLDRRDFGYTAVAIDGYAGLITGWECSLLFAACSLRAGTGLTTVVDARAHARLIASRSLHDATTTLPRLRANISLSFCTSVRLVTRLGCRVVNEGQKPTVGALVSARLRPPTTESPGGRHRQTRKTAEATEQ